MQKTGTVIGDKGMKNKKYIINYLLGLCILLFSAGCVQDDTLPFEPNEGGEGTNFNLTLDLKGMNRPNVTRAATDSPFENISFLIFERGITPGGVIEDEAKCVAIIENPEVKQEESIKEEKEDVKESITYAFQFKPKKDKDYHLVVIANGTQKITEESEYKAVREAAIFDISREETDASKADFKKYPFWGELFNFTGEMNSASEISLRLQLIPAVAKVTVGFSESLTGWTVSEVFLYHGNKQGNIAYGYHEGESPAIYGLNSKDSPETSIKLSGTPTQPEFYITEANKNIEKPARIVVGLTPKDGETKYFRLDFKKPSSTELEYMDVVRNTHYSFTINAIHSDGSDSADEAAEKISQKIEYDLAAWDNFINDMFYTKDGKYIGVGVGKDAFIAGTEKKEDAVLPLQTNYDEEELRIWLKNTNGGKGSIKVYSQYDLINYTRIEAKLEVLKEYGLSIVISYDDIQEHLKNNEVPLAIKFQDDLGNGYIFKDLVIRYAVPIKSFKLTNASFIEKDQVFYSLKQFNYPQYPNNKTTLKVEYEYDSGGATVSDKSIDIRTPTIGGVWFDGTLKLGEHKDTDGKFYFILTAQGKVMMNDPKHIAWNEEIKLFPIDASAIRKHFYIENEAEIKDKLYCNIPFISNRETVQYKVLLVNKVNYANDHTSLKNYIENQLGGKSVAFVNNIEPEYYYDAYSHHATLFLMTDIDVSSESQNKILELYDEEIVNTEIFDKPEFYRVFLHCSHGSEANGKSHILETILGTTNYNSGEFIRERHRRVNVQYTAEGIDGESNDNKIDLQLGRTTDTNKIKYKWRARPNETVVSDVYSFNTDEKEGTIITTKVKYAYVHFFRGTAYNYFWAGTSAFFENKSMENKNNKEMVDRILRPLKGLIKQEFLGKTPAMHYNGKESLFGYPLVHFKIEYE